MSQREESHADQRIGRPGHRHELIYPPIQEFWDAAVAGTD